MWCLLRLLRLRLVLLLLLLLLAGCDECAGEERQENCCAGEAGHYSPFLSALDILPRQSQRRPAKAGRYKFKAEFKGNGAGGTPALQGQRPEPRLGAC